MLGFLIHKLISPFRVLFVSSDHEQKVCAPLIFKNKKYEWDFVQRRTLSLFLVIYSSSHGLSGASLEEDALVSCDSRSQ